MPWESHKVVIMRFIPCLWDCHGALPLAMTEKLGSVKALPYEKDATVLGPEESGPYDCVG